MGIFDEGKSNHSSTYKMVIYLRPAGQCNMQYLSGFADCLCAALKVGGEAINRTFKNSGGILECRLLMTDEGDGGEEETVQWIVDVIERASIAQGNVDISVDGKKITLVVEK